jgi:hypothetical protein
MIIILSEYLSMFISFILIILQINLSIKSYFIRFLLWNLLMTYITMYFVFDLYMMYSIPLDQWTVLNTVHHLCSLLLSFISIIHQFYTFELSLCLFLHYFKNIVIYNVIPHWYFSFCLIYNLSYFGIIYQGYHWNKDNRLTLKDTLQIVVLIIIQTINNTVHGKFM